MFNIPKFLLRSNAQINFNKYLFPTTVRCCTTESNSQFTQSDFKPIYKFDYIRGFSFINRLKLHVTAATGIAVPLALGLSELNYLQKDEIGVNLGLGKIGFSQLVSCF